jgi:hypothetical protein
MPTAMPNSYRGETDATVLGTGENNAVRAIQRQTSPDGLIHGLGNAYIDAPPSAQCEMLAMLLRPPGLLSLVSIADGAFAKLVFKDGAISRDISIDLLPQIQFLEVLQLIDHCIQVSAGAMDHRHAALLHDAGDTRQASMHANMAHICAARALADSERAMTKFQW